MLIPWIYCITEGKKDGAKPLGQIFVSFCPILITISIIQIEKSLDGVLGIRTHSLSLSLSLSLSS